jgi:hypothetical protein
MTLTRRTRYVAAAVTTAVAVVMSAGVAHSFWSASATGGASAQAAGFNAPVVTAGAVTGNQLYPGLTANGTTAGGDLVVVASNPNPFAVTVSVSIPVGGTVTGCGSPAVSLLGTPSFTLPANQSTGVTRVMTRVVSMGTGSSADCQGQPLTIPLSTVATTAP